MQQLESLKRELEECRKAEERIAAGIDLLALDAMNPRAVLYQLGEIRSHVGYLPHASVHGQMSPLARAVLRVHTDLAVQTPETLDTATLRTIQGEIGAISGLLSAAYLV